MLLLIKPHRWGLILSRENPPPGHVNTILRAICRTHGKSAYFYIVLKPHHLIKNMFRYPEKVCTHYKYESMASLFAT